MQADDIMMQCDKLTACELLDILVLSVHPQQGQEGAFIDIFSRALLHLHATSGSHMRRCVDADSSKLYLSQTILHVHATMSATVGVVNTRLRSKPCASASACPTLLASRDEVQQSARLLQPCRDSRAVHALECLFRRNCGDRAMTRTQAQISTSWSCVRAQASISPSCLYSVSTDTGLARVLRFPPTLIAMSLASSFLHHHCASWNSRRISRHAAASSICPGRNLRRLPSSARDKTMESGRCRIQCSSSSGQQSSTSDQQPSTSGRQDTQQSLPHSNEKRQGQKGMLSSQGLKDTQQSLSHSDRYKRGQKGMPYKLISTLALGGTALTAYLAVSKLSGAPVVCLASGGCGSVLNSEYATVFGIPLSALGLGAYSAVTALAVKGSLSQSPQDAVTRYGVLAGGAVLASCSSSLL